MITKPSPVKMTPFTLEIKGKLMDDRKQEEITFHDRLRTSSFDQRWSPDLEKTIQNNPLWANMKYYSIERKSRKIVLDWLADNCRGKRILDYCCGNGDDSFIIARSDAKEIIGIDISKISIENCQERANKESLGKNTRFYVMDAEDLEFDEDYFDIITEYGSLHHLDLKKAYSELSRVLSPKGKCICTESLGYNPVIHYYRKKTPHLRTEFEVKHILKRKHIFMAYNYFTSLEILGFFHLMTLLAVPFRNSPSIFNPLLKCMEVVDSILLKLPLLKWQAWQIVFVLSQPIKTKTI